MVASKAPAGACPDLEAMPESTTTPPHAGSGPIDVRTAPDRYRHWRLRVDDRIATLELDVDESGGLAPGYELKLNSYDLGVDIELADAVQRLRFEHPEVAAVVIRSGRERVFCAGANIRMLGASSHAHKVAFCKFTNETRCAIEDASAHSGQRYLCAIDGTAAGGGYELAMAADWILLVDDGSSAVSLPEVALLGVLPGTGGLVRVVDKRKVRRDRADFFSTTEEGVRGRRALEWGLVDEIAPSSRFGEAVEARARALAAPSDRPAGARGIRLRDLERRIEDGRIRYRYVEADIDRGMRACRIRIGGPAGAPPADVDRLVEAGDAFWPLALAREIEDLVLHLRHNEPEIGTLVVASEGEPGAVADHDAFLLAHREHWLVREILLYWKRLLKRVDLTSRSLVALVEPGSCFAGFLLELVLAADRGYMLDGAVRGRRRGSHGAPHGVQLRLLPRRQRPDSARSALPGRRGGGEPRPPAGRPRSRRRRRRGAPARHLHPRRHRLGRRGAHRAGGARVVLAGRAHRHGGEPALPRPGDDGVAHLRAADGLAELDLPARERGRRARGADALRHRGACGLRPEARVARVLCSRT